MDMHRRQFFRVSAAGLVGSSLVAMGFSPAAALAQPRAFKLASATVARSICPYCSVSCGMLIYKLGDGSKNAKNHVIHVEGDPDNPVSRGSLCPKGAGVKDMINSPARIRYPSVREAGASEWKRISWDDALSRVAKHMKADRDANFETQNAAGTTVNRWATTGFLMCSSSSNESSYLTVKVARALGMVGIDTQARV
jgi:formate dehydrogenase major subunit